MSILQTTALTKHYGKDQSITKALDGVNISIERGEFVAVTGKSGSGKSTMLHLLGGLDTPTSGEIIVDGENITTLREEALAVYRRRKVGFVFQAFNLMPSLNVWENTVLPLGLDGRRPDRGFVLDILITLGISEKHSSLPSTLSGGQQQRVAIARASCIRILKQQPRHVY